MRILMLCALMLLCAACASTFHQPAPPLPEPAPATEVPPLKLPPSNG